MSAVASHMMKRVLVLGSGFMSGPLVELLTRDGTVAVTVASNIEEQARQLARSFQNTTATKIDVKSESSLGSLISGHDLVVSYVPYQLHPLVAKQCIAHHVNMVTSSYVSPGLKELEDQVNASGITMLNEVGLDPGIDHMLAMECFDEVHGKGGKVTSFQSWCGGLPAPECADNPLKYKFSWSPRNVIIGTLQPAKYLKDGKVVEIPAGGSVMGVAKPIQLYPDVELEGYPNRDSVPYMDIYGIPEARDILRGTLRYKGFCSVAVGLQKLGLVSETQHQRLQPDAAPLRWKDLLGMLISQTDITQPDLKSAVYEALDRDDLKMKAIEDLRLLSDAPVELCGSPLDSLSAHLQRMLQYSPGEKDAIYLHHTVGIEWPDKTKELRHINLTLYGAPHGFSAMAQCVGKPAAIAAMMILKGELTKKGILRPMSRDVYTPVLDKLGREGIKATIRTEHS